MRQSSNWLGETLRLVAGALSKQSGTHGLPVCSESSHR